MNHRVVVARDLCAHKLLGTKACEGDSSVSVLRLAVAFLVVALGVGIPATVATVVGR